MALLILGRWSVSHAMCCDLVAWQNMKKWHRLRLVSSLLFWMVEMVDGTITLLWLVDLRQQSTDALNLYGQLLLDKDIAIRIVLFITILQNKRYHVCHDRFMKFKMRWIDCLDVWLQYIFAHNSASRWVCYIHWKLERNLRTFGIVTKVYMLKKCYCRKLRRQIITSYKWKGDESGFKSCFNHG